MQGTSTSNVHYPWTIAVGGASSVTQHRQEIDSRQGAPTGQKRLGQEPCHMAIGPPGTDQRDDESGEPHATTLRAQTPVATHSLMALQRAREGGQDSQATQPQNRS